MSFIRNLSVDRSRKAYLVDMDLLVHAFRKIDICEGHLSVDSLTYLHFLRECHFKGRKLGLESFDVRNIAELDDKIEA